MISPSATRVSNQTEEAINNQIRRRTETNIAYFAAHPDQIGERLAELDEEWDIERTLETASSCVSLFGLMMTVLRGRKWLILPIAVQGFFLQHALQGWCPPLPVFRKMGVRTQYEIEQERYALKALRGDFQKLPKKLETSARSDQVVEAVKR